MKYRAVFLLWALSLAFDGGLACAGDSPQAALAEEGHTIYNRQCSRCHGHDMVNEGQIGIDLRKFPKDAHDRFVNSVRSGKPPRMPPWGDVLSSEEIEALWAYVQSGGSS